MAKITQKSLNEFELVDTDGVEYETWEHKKTKDQYNVPIEREEDLKGGEPQITRYFEDATTDKMIEIFPLDKNGDNFKI
jgi:hypothetical protein